MVDLGNGKFVRDGNIPNPVNNKLISGAVQVEAEEEFDPEAEELPLDRIIAKFVESGLMLE